ncbi:MAG: S1 RNA-binding domain-containing protein [Anaerolineae bacterium]|nr:S1 RNA-binding domain-containing protein [Anaerolineae bacterium]
MSVEKRARDSQRDEKLDAEFLQLLEASMNVALPERGEIRNATILQVDPKSGDIIVDLGSKQDGIVPAQDLDRLDPEYKAKLKVGQEVPVYVMNPRDSDGNLIVSINQGLQQYDWDAARALLGTDEVVEVTVTGHNRGGVLVRWNRLEGFIPSSHLITIGTGGSDRRDSMTSLNNVMLGVKVIEVDQSRRRLIFSEREAQKEWRQQQKAKLLAELMEGEVVTGKVTGLRDFGAFINLGGADGLIHVSELAWHRVDHPRDVLHIGDEIEVYVLSLDRGTNRIALSRKRLLPDPWSDAMNRYHEGQQVEGIVTNVVDFGAFIALDDGLEGLLHLSEMGDGALKEPYSYVKKGDRLPLRISRLEPDKRRVGFTQRWGMPPVNADGEPIEGAENVEGMEDVEGQAPVDVDASADSAVDAPVADVADVAEVSAVNDVNDVASTDVDTPADESSEAAE